MNFTQIKQETLSVDGDPFNGSNLKRRRMDECDDIQMSSPTKMGHLIMSGDQPTCIQSTGTVPSTSRMNCKIFLHIRHSPFVYHTESWKPKGCTMYLPLTEDVMVNTRNIEQISFESDQYFLADEKGNYVGAKPGHAIHLWRFDIPAQKLYISRSILFLKGQDYANMRVQLDAL